MSLTIEAHHQQQLDGAQRVDLQLEIFPEQFQSVDPWFHRLAVQAGGTGHVLEAGREAIEDADVLQRHA